MTITISPDLRGAELAQSVAEYITANPAEWDQGVWGERTACGTTMCFGGTALLMSGRAKWYQSAGYAFLDTPREGSFSGPAGEVLGLTDEQAEALFYEFYGRGEEGVAEMWRFVATLYPEGAITIPEKYRTSVGAR